MTDRSLIADRRACCSALLPSSAFSSRSSAPSASASPARRLPPSVSSAARTRPDGHLLTNKLAPELLRCHRHRSILLHGADPLIQPPIMSFSRARKTARSRWSRLASSPKRRSSSIIVTIFVILLLPSTAPLVSCLMLTPLLPEVRCDGSSVGHRAECAHEHCYHHALDLRRLKPWSPRTS